MLNSELWINGCVGLKQEQVAELRILPRNGCFYAEYVYNRVATSSGIPRALAEGEVNFLSNC